MNRCAHLENSPDSIYDPAYVQRLFDEMSTSYDRMNYLTSFGFSHRWRRQFVEAVGIRAGMKVCDLMAGRGECWSAIQKMLGARGTLIAVDFSSGMLRGAHGRIKSPRALEIEIRHEDVLKTEIESASIDVVVSGFGLKTFSPSQLEQLAQQVFRILKPGGLFSFVDVSVPPALPLRVAYMFYLKRIIPLLGRLLLGNPESYRMLGVYTERFRNCHLAREAFEGAGLTTRAESYFYGCATGLTGIRPFK